MSIFPTVVSNLKREKQKIKPIVSYPKLGRVKPSLPLGFWIGFLSWCGSKGYVSSSLGFNMYSH